MTMNLTPQGYAALEEMLIVDEGFSQFVYLDTLKNETFGIGFLLRLGLSLEESKAVLKVRLAKLETDLSHAQSLYLNLDENRKIAILDMAYNIGIAGICNFKNMWTAIERKDYKQAALEMLNSDWAEQVGARAKRLANIMLNGCLSQSAA